MSKDMFCRKDPTGIWHKLCDLDRTEVTEKEAVEIMKNQSLVILTGCSLALWLAMPAWAQRGHRVGGGAALSAHSMSRLSLSDHSKGMSAKAHTSTSARANAEMRSNKGAKLKSLDRAEAVQKMNTRADTERGFTTAPGLAKAGTKAHVSASDQASNNASAKAGSHKASASANASEHMNADAQTGAGLSTAPGLATAATHTSASANSGAAANASAHMKSSKKPTTDKDSPRGTTAPEKN